MPEIGRSALQPRMRNCRAMSRTSARALMRWPPSMSPRTDASSPWNALLRSNNASSNKRSSTNCSKRTPPCSVKWRRCAPMNERCKHNCAKPKASVGAWSRSTATGSNYWRSAPCGCTRWRTNCAKRVKPSPITANNT
ncbi:hypothetical protein D3C72_1746410 [compost metagenome]